jgi:hypothetical protein
MLQSTGYTSSWIRGFAIMHGFIYHEETKSDLLRDDFPGVFLWGCVLGGSSVDTMGVVVFACYNT